MTAQPKPIRPTRKVETYLFDHHGHAVEIPAAEVDRAGGVAVCTCGARLQIRWRAARQVHEGGAA